MSAFPPALERQGLLSDLVANQRRRRRQSSSTARSYHGAHRIRTPCRNAAGVCWIQGIPYVTGETLSWPGWQPVLVPVSTSSQPAKPQMVLRSFARPATMPKQIVWAALHFQ